MLFVCFLCCRSAQAMEDTDARYLIAVEVGLVVSVVAFVLLSWLSATQGLVLLFLFVVARCLLWDWCWEWELWDWYQQEYQEEEWEEEGEWVGGDGAPGGAPGGPGGGFGGPSGPNRWDRQPPKPQLHKRRRL